MKNLICVLMLTLLSISVFSQTKTGTLKVFSDLQTITVFVDDNLQSNYKDVKLPVGTHYVKIMNGSEKLYGKVITINADQVTSILAEEPKVAVKETSSQVEVKQATGKGGTINVFSEFTGVSIYLNEIKQGDDIKTISNVPAGNHYFKVIKDGVSIFAELITVKDGETTTVLVKNSGQVADKIMESKTPQREEYQQSKIDVLLTSNAVSTTTGKSNYYPGFYGYYGYNKSVTNTVNVSDFKIIKGGVAEISEMDLAGLADNQDILSRNAKDNAKIAKTTSIGAIVFLTSMLVGVPVLIDCMHKPTPTHPGGFLHPKTSVVPKWEAPVLATCIVTGTISYCITMGADKHKPAHYYTPDNANADAQKYNKFLKKKLSLPESYDVK